MTQDIESRARAAASKAANQKRVEAKAGAAIPLEVLRQAVETHGRNCVAKLVKDKPLEHFPLAEPYPFETDWREERTC